MLNRAVHFVFLCACLFTLPVAGQAQVREYYLAAEEVIWNFAPIRQHLVHCYPEAEPCAIPEPWTDSHSFPVTRFIQYTDADFQTPVTQPECLGILGPILRAEVGDVIRVHFCNHFNRPIGLHPRDLRYTKVQEGVHCSGVNSGQGPGLGAAIPPGECFDYEWQAAAESGPSPGESSWLDAQHQRLYFRKSQRIDRPIRRNRSLFFIDKIAME
ncbi:MAG: hypothetical protein ACPW60_15285 [Methylohalobius sp. ZOD2]